MSTLPQAADGTSLKIKALLFFALTVLLILTAAGGLLAGKPPAILAALALLLCGAAAALLCFHNWVLRPLTELQAAVRSMADGRLDQLSRISRADEIGRLGEGVNDLAINMQEVLLFAWNHSQQSRSLIDGLAERLAALPVAGEDVVGIENDVAHLRADNEDLKAIVMSFSYFEIRLEHERMLAEMDCCGDGGCGPDAPCRQK